MQSETRICKNCKQNFIIEPDDFSFYEKIKVPPPTFCPECRLQRRLTWMISLILFKRKCDLCGEEEISMYEPNTPFKIYCHKCWWSDKWDARDYAKDVDFSKPFLEQWNELFHETPILGLSIDTITGELSPYTNQCGHAKDCYMIYYSDHNEECMYGFQLTNNKMCLNSTTVLESSNVFDSSNVFKSYNIIGATSNNRSCLDCFFIRDCEGCHNCFGAVNVKNGSYVFMGEKLPKEEYKKRLKKINLGSYEQYYFWKEKAYEYFKQNIPQPRWETQSYNSTGSYVFKSKNCTECYDVTGCEDSKYLMLIKEGTVKNSYDYSDWGLNAELVYESGIVGENISNIKFCHESGFNIENIEYSKLQTGGNNCFGCVSLRQKQYCILNKQYTKEEYFKLREKIIEHMNKMPYIDKNGNVYKYGEFFPMEFSPHAYNNTFANFLFPKTEEECKKDGLQWYQSDVKEYPITILASDIPDNIKNTTDEITKKIVGCSTCPKGYKIIKPELDLSRRLNVPLSRQCPFCRIGDKVKKWVSQMKQVDRICDKCGITFKTHYSKEEALKIFCQPCYRQEVY